MRNYYSTLRAIFFILIGLHVSLYFFGLLRLSIIYDYLDYWPLTLFLIFLVLLPKSSLITESVKFYSYAVLISVMVIFLLAHFTKASFLGTYSYESSFSNLTLNESDTYRVIINENNSINLKSFPGTGYKVDILNKPGSSGYPEAVESLVGTPRVLVLRAVETSPLLQVKGWDLQLGDESKWELDIFGVDSQYSLDNLELNNKLTNFSNLQSMEKKYGFSERLSKKEMFFRNGKVGEWKNILSKKQSNLIEKTFEKEMLELGYL